jgi:hypothetical protein
MERDDNSGIEDVQRGGNIFTDILIFERPDIFAQCPPTLQKAILQYHQAVNLLADTRLEEGRILMNSAFETLKHEK